MNSMAFVLKIGVTLAIISATCVLASLLGFGWHVWATEDKSLVVLPLLISLTALAMSAAFTSLYFVLSTFK